MTDTMNVGFENYIVFHRGIAEIYIDKTNNHLVVVYQDGTEKDFGDPFGDDARAQAANAQQIVDEAQEIANEVNADTKALKEEVEALKAAAQEIQANTDTSSAQFAEAVDAKTHEVIEAIEGVQKLEEKDEEGNVTNVTYFIDVAKATNADVDALFDEEA